MDSTGVRNCVRNDEVAVVRGRDIARAMVMVVFGVDVDVDVDVDAEVTFVTAASDVDVVLLDATIRDEAPPHEATPAISNALPKHSNFTTTVWPTNGDRGTHRR